MADATIFPDQSYFQWSRPGAENPRLSAPIGESDTTIAWTNPPLDASGNIIAGDFLMGIRNAQSYVESVYIPADAVSPDGLSATGVIRGVNLEGLDFTTSNAALAASHEQDSAVFCQISGVWAKIFADALKGLNDIATGGNNFVMGDATDSTITVKRTDSSSVFGWLRWEQALGKVQFSNDGTTWVSMDDVIAGDLVRATAADSTPGYLNDKLVAGDNVTLTVLNPGADEEIEITAASKNETAVAHETYTAAFMTGGNAPTGNFLLWLGTSDGEFRFTLDGSVYDITGIDTTAVADMTGVAAVIEGRIQAVTGTLATCIWNGTAFVITSVNTTVNTQVSVLEAVPGGVGTDISGVNPADPQMDADAGNGTETAGVLDPSADAGKVPELNAEGNINPDFLGEVMDTGGYTLEGQIPVADSSLDGALLDPVRNNLVVGSDQGGIEYRNGTSVVDRDFTLYEITNGDDLPYQEVVNYNVPGGMLGTNNVLRISLYFGQSQQDNSSGTDIEMRLQYGGNVFFAYEAPYGSSTPESTNRPYKATIEIWKTGDANNMRAYVETVTPGADGSDPAPIFEDSSTTTISVDTSVDQDLIVDMRWNDPTATISGVVRVEKSIIELTELT